MHWLMILYCIIGAGIATNIYINSEIGVVKAIFINLFWPAVLAYLIANKLNQ